MNHLKQQTRRLVVLLIRPSKYYDPDGYLLHWWFGAMPSNSLAVMYTLTKAAFALPQLAHIPEKEVFASDELVASLDPQKFMKKHVREGTTVVVGLVGVQTNMFPRACDLAGEFLKAGATVVIGGFHVSGSITMLHDDKHPVGMCPHKKPFDCELMPPECAKIMREGVIIFHGEAEKLWPDVLADIYNGRQQSLYRGGRPDLSSAPLPSYPPNYFENFLGNILTLDSGRGCPFDCSFCTIINVQGRSMRFRAVEAIEAWIRKVCATDDRRMFWFFTDDNFCRNPFWEDILLVCKKLRGEGLEFGFMTQSDLAAWRLKGPKTKRPFVELLAAAGCTQIFLGVESVNQDALRQTGKPQNLVATYRQQVDLYHSVGILCHASYIIGFPNDTPETVAKSVRILQEIGFDQVSFYMLTPLPGSEDHAKMHAAGIWMDPDFNTYDSFRPSMRHPLMSPQVWQKVYDDAWRAFYTRQHVVSVLFRVNPRNYWGSMRTFLWYIWSALEEGVHPMLGGVHRRRHWRDRRPGLEKKSRLRFWSDELRRHLRYIASLMRVYFFFQDVYLQTRWVPTIRKRTAHIAGVPQWLRDDMRARVQAYSASVRQSTWFGRTFGRAAHRAWLDSFWKSYAQLKWRLILPHKFHWHVQMLGCALSEFCYSVRFNTAVLAAVLRQKI